MKKLILIIAVIVVIGIVAGVGWIIISSKNSSPNNPSNPNGSLPPVPSTVPGRVQSQAQNGTSVFVQGVSSPQNPAVAKDFLGKIQNADQIALGGTVMASPYALQIWGDTNKGGEALLEYTSSTGWTLMSLGGGEWNTLALIQIGVPVSAAKQLVAGVKNGASLSPTTSPIISPAGTTITIGTSEGSVIMNNFYNNPAYIDQEQQAVVIQQSSTYNSVYYILDSHFTLTILGAPSQTIRKSAEAAFLMSLGISQNDACKLKVYESFPGDGAAAGQQQSLSFCKSGAAF